MTIAIACKCAICSLTTPSSLEVLVRSLCAEPEAWVSVHLTDGTIIVGVADRLYDDGFVVVNDDAGDPDAYIGACGIAHYIGANDIAHLQVL